MFLFSSTALDLHPNMNYSTGHPLSSCKQSAHYTDQYDLRHCTSQFQPHSQQCPEELKDRWSIPSSTHLASNCIHSTLLSNLQFYTSSWCSNPEMTLLQIKKKKKNRSNQMWIFSTSFPYLSTPWRYLCLNPPRPPFPHSVAGSASEAARGTPLTVLTTLWALSEPALPASFRLNSS